MRELLYCEFLKLKRTKIYTVLLLGILVPPVLAMFSSIKTYNANPEYGISLFTLYDSAFMFLMLLFGPLVFSIMASWLFSREYGEKTLKTILVIPIPKRKFILGKFLTLFVCIMVLMLSFWASILLLCIFCNIFVSVEQLNFGTAIFFLFKIAVGGILLYLVIMPIAYLAFRTKGLVTPMIAAAIIALLNVLLTNAPFAGFFPWTAAYLIANGRMRYTICPTFVSLIIIFGVAFVSYRYCCKLFEKQDIN